MSEQCKHTRRTGTLSMHRCERTAIIDGYCMRHHHNYWSAADWAALTDEDRAELSAAGRGRENFLTAVTKSRGV